uniref:Transposase n=1 Tax=Globodera rostochiensis TaxID=31243 RepID=A0A914IHK0_GLORO
MVLFATNLLDKAESVKVKLEELPLKTFDEIFGEGWWDKGEAEDLKMQAPTNYGQNFHHQIDRQNTQIGQIEPNSTDQNPQLKESDHTGQIEPNSTDQNPPLTEADHFDNAKNGDEQNEIIKEMTSNAEDKRKQKFDQKKAELTRAGIKNSYKHEIGETVAKELGLGFTTINRWKQKLGQTKPNHKYAYSEQKELMKLYYEIKGKNPKINDKEIVKLLKIGTRTLYVWKRQFKRQQFNPNSVVGHSVEENAAANVQEIGTLSVIKL